MFWLRWSSESCELITQSLKNKNKNSFFLNLFSFYSNESSFEILAASEHFISQRICDHFLIISTPAIVIA